MWILCCAAAAGLLAIQSVLVHRFVRAARRPPLDERPPSESCNVLVVLCARGRDPSLLECLQQLDQQTWRKSRIVVAVDHPDDPARVAVDEHRTVTSGSRVECLVVPPQSDRCSLKCNSLAAAVAQLGQVADVVVTIDADVVPAKNWIESLVGVLLAGPADATFGNRWFDPRDGRVGSWVRYIWNAAAIVQMVVYRIPWGGSLAVRRTAIDESQLVATWRVCLFEDVVMAPALTAVGKSVQPAAHVILVNREGCSLRSAWDWMTRQLLDARLYHPSWPLVVAHAAAGAGVRLAFGISTVVAAFAGGLATVAPWLVAWLTFELANLGLLEWFRLAVRSANSRAAKEQAITSAERKGWRSAVARVGWQLLLIAPVAILHFGAMIRAARAQSTTWRGIRYQIAGPFQICRSAYAPCAGPPEMRDNQSLA